MTGVLRRMKGKTSRLTFPHSSPSHSFQSKRDGLASLGILDRCPFTLDALDIGGDKVTEPDMSTNDSDQR
jgi:hypothetical protein